MTYLNRAFEGHDGGASNSVPPELMSFLVVIPIAPHPTLELFSSASSIESKPGEGDVAPAPAPENAAATNNSNSYHHPPVNSVHAPQINSAHVNSLKVGRRCAVVHSWETTQICCPKFF